MLRANSRTLPIEDIKIPEAFAQTTPRREKVDKAKAFYGVTRQFDKPMLIDRKGYIFDGYARLTAAKELGLDKVPVVQIVPFKKKADKPANKYEGMSNGKLDLEMCAKKGGCSVYSNPRRKHDCPFYGTGHCNVTDANRAEVIRYLLEEDAASGEPETMPAEDKPKFKVGDKVKIVRARLLHKERNVGDIAAIQEINPNGDMFDGETHYSVGNDYIWFENELEPYAAPSFDWDAFQAGKVAVHCDTEEKAKEFVQKCRENLSKRATELWEKGETNWNEYKEDTCYISDSDETLCYSPESFFRRSRYTIIDYPFSEQPAEPTEPTEQKEPIKLYCFEDRESGTRLTKDKIYETDTDGYITYDDGCRSSCKYGSDIWKNGITGISSRLVPLVKRPAKVGEWVLVTNRPGLDADIYKNGDACKVVDANRNKPLHSDGVFIKTLSGKTHLCNRGNGTAFLFDSEYEVLDGYHPEPEAEKEPEFYSGKVVCVKADGYFTVGKIYKFRDGLIKSDTGDSYNKGEPIKSLEELGDGTWVPKFIEYKGEAND